MLKNMANWKLIAVGVLAALLAAAVAETQAAEDKGRQEAFQRRLGQRGFTVQKGSVEFPEILDMCCKCQLPSCYGNNASSTYGLFALPPAPGQTAVNPYAEWFTEDKTLPPDWSYWWRMRPDEAVVFIGPTPPKVSYYGFTAYIYDRFVRSLPPGSDCQCQTGENCPRPQPGSALHRYPTYASLGDTLNQMTISVPGGRHDPYEKNVVVLMAADRNTERAVRKELIAAGYPADSINLLPVSPSIARLGLDSQDDTVSLLMRVAPIPGTDVAPYHDVPKSIFRITPRKPVPLEELAPIAPPELSIRGTGETELALLPAVDALEQAILAKYSDYTPTAIKMATLPEGYNCLENTQNCLADNRDTIYISPAYNILNFDPLQDLTLKPDSGEFYVAYGVIHPEVNKATYSNISVMGWARKAAPIMVNNPEMVGSARYYLGSNVEQATADKIYAYKIARPRGCNDAEPCKEVGYDCGSGIGTDEGVALIFRAYVEPSTAVGPALGEVILDRILKFTPKTR
jgi:hypothetical protein